MGGLWSADWSYCNRHGGCANEAIDGVPVPGPALRIPSAARRVRIVFGTSRKPARVSLLDYSHVDQNGEIAGDFTRLPVRLRPRGSGGAVIAWRAFFTLRGTRQHYLEVHGVWRPGQRQRGGSGDADWVFHARGVS